MIKDCKIGLCIKLVVIVFCVMLGNQNLLADNIILPSEQKKTENPDELDEIQLEINLIPTQFVCFGENGDIRLFIQHGTPPYDFQWSNGSITQDLYNVPPGVYSVTVTDGTSDYVVESAVIEELPSLNSQITLDVTNIFCHGTSTGSISTTFNNNTGPYSYVWSNGSSASSINNLSVGTYSFTVTDAYSCQMDSTIVITEPDTIIASVYTSPASCYGTMDGMAWVNIFGGVPFDTTINDYEYIYSWPNPNVNSDTINYYGGSYTLTVTDANNCVIQFPFTIDQPSQVLALQVGDRQICIGGETLLATEVTGGNPPYLFYWIDVTNNDTVFTNEITVHPTVTSNYYFYAEDSHGCTSNVVNSTVNVYPPINLLSLTVDKDSICPGEELNVNLDVEGGNGGPYQLLLNNSQIVSSPFSIYPEETATYTIQINDQCSTPAVESSFDVVVMPNPPVGFNVDYRESCPPGIFSFVEFSPDLGQSYMWDFGDTQFSIDKNPVHIYTDAGEYDVSLTATSDFGCKKTLTIEDLIKIHNKPDAEFYTDRNHASILDPIIQFFNVSSYADSIFWYFGDGDSTLYSQENPWHEFEAIGMYNVRMVAENSHGCIDTTYKKIRIVDEYTFNAPDVFTPNNDGVNDCFRLCAHGIDVQEFEFYVYDRFGSIVYQTTSFENDKPCIECGEGSWDGTFNGSYTKGDVLCEPGMYAWYCVYQDAAGVDNVARGVVTLMR